MHADRVFVPPSLRSTILRQFHSGHPGISRMKSIARSYAYWPGMDADIENLVKQCSKCQAAAKLPAREAPIPWTPTEKPWSRIHIDFAGPINGVSYLIVVDSYSKWPEVVPLTSTTSTTTIAVLRRIFSQHGLPDTVVSDNGSQFTSAPFRDFCRQNGIEHVCSPPYHPQSNGQAERFVDTFKRALLKSRGEGTTEEILQAFLFAYRTTPNPATPDHKTPAEALMGRKLRTIHCALIPLGTRPARPQGKYANNGFSIGTAVYARDYRPGHDYWTEAKITKRRGNVVHEVSVNGKIWVRHHNQLRPRQSTKPSAEISFSLPLDILLDTFSMSQVPHSAPSRIKSDIRSPDVSPEPRRFPDRQRRSTRVFQIDPKHKRYG